MTRIRASLYILLVAVIWPAILVAQVPVGDSAWVAGDFTTAKRAYEQALVEDSTSVRALIRLGMLRAWDGKTDSAQALYGKALRYEPDNVGALTARGQLAAWSGDYLTAVQHYLKALHRDSTYTPAWVALAEVRRWQGRPADANAAIEHAIALAPEDRSAIEGRASIRAMTRPELTAQLGWSHDSDENTLWWQSVGISSLLRRGLTGFASAGAAEASDPIRDGTRLSAEAGVILGAGNVSLTGAAGVRSLDADGLDSRTAATWRAGLSYRFAPTAGIGLNYSHYTLDETALLMGSDIDADEVSVDGDIQVTDRLSFGAGAGRTWFNDDNERWSVIAALTERATSRLYLGLYGRAMGYDQPGTGYFAPDRFLLGEVRGSYSLGSRRFEARISGGLGAQQIGEGGDAQTEWHAEARVARRWAVINEVALSGGVSNSAAASTTGAYRYYTAVLTLRLGL